MRYHVIVGATDDRSPEHTPWKADELASLLADSCKDDPVKTLKGFDLTDAQYARLLSLLYQWEAAGALVQHDDT
jgi:hypothetical protein